MQYFKKELVSNALRLPNGKAVRFEKVGDDTGLLATEDEGLIEELKKVMARKVGGVTEIAVEEFEEIKKNPPARPSRLRSLDARSVIKLLRKPSIPSVDVEAVKSEPLVEPSTLVTVSSLKKLRATRAAEPAV
jgi:hypothetical protein